MIPCFRHRDTEAVVTIRYQGHDVPACQSCVHEIRALRRPTPTPEAHMPTEPSPSRAEFDAIFDSCGPPQRARAPFRSTPISRGGQTPNIRLPLVLRPRADAHPGCRIDDCPSTSDYSRHLCRTHHKQATKAGLLEQLAAPANQGRVAAGRRGGKTKAKNREASMVRVSNGKNPDVDTTDEILGGWETHDTAPDGVDCAAPVDAGGPRDDSSAVTDAVALGDPAPPVTLARDDTAYMWPSGRTAIGRVRADGQRLAWADTEDSGAALCPSLDSAVEYLGARLPDPVCSKTETPDAAAPTFWGGVDSPPWPGPIGTTNVRWRVGGPSPDAPDAGDQMTARERELTAQVEAQAGQIRRLESALATERSLCDSWTEAVDLAHAALNDAKVPQAGTIADRIRALTERLASAEKAGRFLLTAAADDMVIDPALGAALVLLLEEAQKAGRAPSPGLVAAFRAALGVGDV